ncbi:MAG TPA: hypothetical protein VHW01_26235, partial [Polyangiaceae bacterium]|nr:hypothetical protein [Polyangiaceae bacterium]
MIIPRIKGDQASVLLTGLCLVGIAACGVAEHSKSTPQVDPSCDFGCGGAVTSAGAPGVPMGGSPQAGSAPAIGGATTAGGGDTSLGGTSAAGAATGGTSAAGASTGGAATGGASTGGSAGSAPLSGVTITLGTNVVPMEHAIAFIHIGHSNMAGRATVPAASRAYHFTETDPHAWMYHAAANGGGGMPGPPALAIEPKTAGDTPGNAGPGTSLVKQAAALAP